MGKFLHVKGAARTPKYLFLYYCTNASIIQLTQLNPLRYWLKLEDFSGVVVKKTSWWRMVGSKRGRKRAKEVTVFLKGGECICIPSGQSDH